MTRFARRAGVLADNSKGDVKKKEDGTSWSEMISEQPGGEGVASGQDLDAADQEKKRSSEDRKRKHQDDYEKRIEFENKSNRFAGGQQEVQSEAAHSKVDKAVKAESLDSLVKRYEQSLDKEVIDDLVSMKIAGKITYEELADKLSREERSNRRRLGRIEERQSSQVCFKCRKAGHSIQDCPLVKSDHEQGTGICYKCGSTEHAVSRCNAKVEPGK